MNNENFSNLHLIWKRFSAENRLSFGVDLDAVVLADDSLFFHPRFSLSFSVFGSDGLLCKNLFFFCNVTLTYNKLKNQRNQLIIPHNDTNA